MKTNLPSISYLDIQVDYVRNFDDAVLFTKQVVRPRSSNRVRITSQLTIFTNTRHVVPQWQSRQTYDKVPCNCMWLHQTQPICVYTWIDNIFFAKHPCCLTKPVICNGLHISYLCDVLGWQCVNMPSVWGPSNTLHYKSAWHNQTQTTRDQTCLDKSLCISLLPLVSWDFRYRKALYHLRTYSEHMQPYPSCARAQLKNCVHYLAT